MLQFVYIDSFYSIAEKYLPLANKDFIDFKIQYCIVFI